MNARTQVFEMALEGRQVEEAVSSLFHTLLFHRTLGKFHYQQDGKYTVGSVGYEDTDCDFVDLTYVRCSSGEMQRIVHKEATAFSECLRSQERETQGQARSGHISLTFYQTKKARWPFPSENIPWEVWNLRMEIMTLASEIERQLYREKVGELLAEKILYIAESMNRPSYVPKMPNQPELDLIFDTGFVDIQPYLFKISYGTSPVLGSFNMGTTVRRLLKDTLSI
ncbi:autophagy-related protein 101-like [Daphnia pulicaria]|uniref:autophagy-related protein 101-like n=1 Tax=Daphnia pulicaria TaxID=35523 RepID=UPI001EECD40D|nr:autophagy-related protein 101-like [Daphnia pulicaria]